MNSLNPLFRWEAVTKLFRDDASLQAMLDFEAALARAESSAGVIPSAAAAAITVKCRAELFDQKKLAEAAALAGNLAIPLVKQLKELVAADNKDAANFVQWGATSQDAIDTGIILQCRDALALIAADVNELCNALAKLADEHRATPIVGRTWTQHAVPTTLGMKFAGWLDALGRHRERLRQTQKNCLVLQFGGAVGTLAVLGSQGETVSKQLATELKLALPQMPWHSHRDRMAEIATTLALLTGTLGKIARDISIHAQTEIDELREPAEPGRGRLLDHAAQTKSRGVRGDSLRRHPRTRIGQHDAQRHGPGRRARHRRLARRMGKPAGNCLSRCGKLSISCPSSCRILKSMPNACAKIWI